MWSIRRWPHVRLFAATYPEKTTALIMIGSYARRLRADDYPWGPTSEQHAHFLEEIRQNWGGPVGIDARAPSLANDYEFRRWWGAVLADGASPGAALALTKMNSQIDVRPILKTIQVPSLVIHRSGDQCLRVEEGRYLAEQIPGAQLVELPGNDHLPFVGHQDEILDAIEQFLTGVSHNSKIKRVLATVLVARFPNDPSSASVPIGISHAVREVELFRGKLNQRTGQVLVASFDGPARAVRAAIAMQSSARRLGIAIRLAVHTGEVNARSMTRACAGQRSTRRAGFVIKPIPPAFVSNTVKDLVAGADLRFRLAAENKHSHLPRELYRVE